MEAEGHRCTLRTRDDRFALKESIGGIERRLAVYPFIIKCHRSYLVNLEHVAAVRKEDLILDNREKVPLSRNMRKPANEAFIRCYSRGEFDTR